MSEPEEPDGSEGRITTAQCIVIAISVLVPGIAVAGLVGWKQFFRGRSPGVGEWLDGLLLGGLLLLAIGCSIFTAWMLVSGVQQSHRRMRWIEYTVSLVLGQIFLAPVIAGIILVFLMV